jgi:hypothetical protein
MGTGQYKAYILVIQVLYSPVFKKTLQLKWSLEERISISDRGQPTIYFMLSQISQ